MADTPEHPRPTEEARHGEPANEQSSGSDAGKLAVYFTYANVLNEPDHPHFRDEKVLLPIPLTESVRYPHEERRHHDRRRADRSTDGIDEREEDEVEVTLPDPSTDLFHVHEGLKGPEPRYPDVPPLATHEGLFLEQELTPPTDNP